MCICSAPANLSDQRGRLRHEGSPTGIGIRAESTMATSCKFLARIQTVIIPPYGGAPRGRYAVFSPLVKSIVWITPIRGPNGWRSPADEVAYGRRLDWSTTDTTKATQAIPGHGSIRSGLLRDFPKYWGRDALWLITRYQPRTEVANIAMLVPLMVVQRVAGAASDAMLARETDCDGGGSARTRPSPRSSP